MHKDKTGPAPDGSQAFSWLLHQWKEKLASALEGMGCPSLVAEIVQSGEAPRDSGVFWWAQQVNLFPRPSLWIGAGEAAWNLIGTQALHAIEFEAPAPGDIRDTYREILSQSLSGVATRLTERFGQEVTCTHGEPLPFPPDINTHGFVRVRIEGCEAVELCFMAGTELVQYVAADQVPATDPEDEAGADRAGQGEPVAVAFDSVLDAEMPVSVSLGTARLCLEEILTLGKGSLVRLSRDAGELVALQVNGCVVARGELVSVRGRYGLRIHELSTQGDRLRQFDPTRWQRSLDTSNS